MNLANFEVACLHVCKAIKKQCTMKVNMDFLRIILQKIINSTQNRFKGLQPLMQGLLFAAKCGKSSYISSVSVTGA